MTEQEQRIAIAEACGWKLCDKAYRIWLPPGSRLKTNEEGGGIEGYWCAEDLLPDYLRDLNAMHKALSAMTDDEWKIFMDFLCIVTGHDKTVLWFYKQSDVVIQMFKATAAQRAEAFLRTIGKWKD